MSADYKYYKKPQLISPKYRFGLIEADFDDNKFVDCAITGNADLILTEDKHFEELKQIDFPKVTAMGILEFQQLI
ncbi:PIN domain-containing protein [Algoriphagus hitonicola]|uniref:PIN domain-containing protein n=1 Tax=Algoriphagus hitonicola TaxID=435880 RepID=UPI0011601ADD|nr:PIN domain-containing protein [Algoriphagus hitonicola]